ncbi:hypothetical protein GmHk_04G010248 [Glycine max]|nr:hypothetical protein GmHk_04G010248 [Glycine max]
MYWKPSHFTPGTAAIEQTLPHLYPIARNQIVLPNGKIHQFPTKNHHFTPHSRGLLVWMIKTIMTRVKYLPPSWITNQLNQMLYLHNPQLIPQLRQIPPTLLDHKPTKPNVVSP